MSGDLVNTVEVSRVMVMDLLMMMDRVIVRMVTVDLNAHAVEKIIVMITVKFKPMVRVFVMQILLERLVIRVLLIIMVMIVLLIVRQIQTVEAMERVIQKVDVIVYIIIQPVLVVNLQVVPLVMGTVLLMKKVIVLVMRVGLIGDHRVL
tara:strand:- start:2681 stop:3127 length:447 start_codon:yes stop_codon:yes gene_type:complete